MNKVVSASRRTDLLAFFPEWLSGVLRKGKADVLGPSGRTYSVDLNPESVHTFVLWSKNFQNLITNRFGLERLLAKYEQIYCHFTITGLGGTFIERGVPTADEALDQLEPLIRISGHPERVTIRFDPVVFWNEKGAVRTNLGFLEKMAPRLRGLGIKHIRFSFAQWYRKAKRRAEKHEFVFLDYPEEEMRRAALTLAGVALKYGLNLDACSQSFLSDIEGIQPSSCIDGRLLQRLHPQNAPVSFTKDKSQRKDCRCTESVDIGSYTQSCPHACLYCYANPRI